MSPIKRLRRGEIPILDGGFYVMPRAFREGLFYRSLSLGQRAIVDELVAQMRWRDEDLRIADRTVRVPRGSVVVHELTLAMRCGLPRITARKALARLVSWGFCRLERLPASSVRHRAVLVTIREPEQFIVQARGRARAA